VWLQHDKLQAADGMSRGDLVLIYESGSGKALREVYADGSAKIIPRHQGRQGVVTLARILDRPSQPEQSQPEQYADGSQRWWRYMAPTEALNSNGFISRVELTQLLGYSPDYAFRGYGRDHAGLAELPEQQFYALRDRYLQAVTERDAATRTQAGGWVGHGMGGEGPAHRALKLAIAADPVTHLGEPGLTHWATEYKLPTGDTIDVVLKDEYGRFVVVEVEVDCDEKEIVGPLQCVKYRALISCLYGHLLEEVRAVLVAYSIHDDARARCVKHTIECQTRARELVLQAH
jgi:hypothetical protein